MGMSGAIRGLNPHDFGSGENTVNRLDARGIDGDVPARRVELGQDNLVIRAPNQALDIAWTRSTMFAMELDDYVVAGFRRTAWMDED